MAYIFLVEISFIHRKQDMKEIVILVGGGQEMYLLRQFWT